MLDLIFITIIVCYIIDVSGFIDSLKIGIHRFIYGNTVVYREFSMKPLDCSLCATWWIGIMYLIWPNGFGLTISHIAYVALLSCFAGTISSVILLIKDMIGTIINKVYDKIE